MSIGLCSGIHYHQPTCFQDEGVVVVVEGLSVLGKDGGEGGTCSFGKGNPFDSACNHLFHGAWLGHFHGSYVHLIANGTSSFNFRDLSRILDRPHGDDGLDQFKGDILFDTEGFNSE